MADLLPAGWTEQVDPGSGNKFYYNAGNGETSWERPKASSGPATALPEGWTEHADASGRVFYYKAATGETSWEKPLSGPPAAARKGIWATEQAFDLGQELRHDILADKVQVLDRASWGSVLKTVQALNDGVLVVEKGMCALFSASKNSYWLLWRDDKADESDKITDAWKKPKSESTLPEGWAEHVDQASGKTFYYKAATGETSWEKPAAAASPAAASGALPEGWAEHLDPGTGKTFYHKAATGETSWEKPKEAGAAAALPEGWAEHKDPASGRLFYCKTATGETSWDRPA